MGAAVFDKFNTMPGETFVASSVDAPPAGEAEQRGDLRLGVLVGWLRRGQLQLFV